MDLIMDPLVVKGKNGLFVYIDKFSEFCCLISILLGEGELSAK